MLIASQRAQCGERLAARDRVKQTAAAARERRETERTRPRRVQLGAARRPAVALRLPACQPASACAVAFPATKGTWSPLTRRDGHFSGDAPSPTSTARRLTPAARTAPLSRPRSAAAATKKESRVPRPARTNNAPTPPSAAAARNTTPRLCHVCTTRTR